MIKRLIATQVAIGQIPALVIEAQKSFDIVVLVCAKILLSGRKAECYRAGHINRLTLQIVPPHVFMKGNVLPNAMVICDEFHGPFSSLAHAKAEAIPNDVWLRKTCNVYPIGGIKEPLPPFETHPGLYRVRNSKLSIAKMKTPWSVADPRKSKKTDKDVLEESIESHFVRLCKKYDVLCPKTEGIAQGFQDRTAIWRKGSCNCPQRKLRGVDPIELKRPVGGKYRPGQLWWRNEVLERGHYAAVIHTHEAVEQYFKDRVCRHIKKINVR